jgi:hypothetical protein
MDGVVIEAAGPSESRRCACADARRSGVRRVGESSGATFSDVVAIAADSTEACFFSFQRSKAEDFFEKKKKRENG